MTVSDDKFLCAFEDCSLPATSFGHLEHVRLAWLYLQRFPADEALHRFVRGLRRFAGHLGVPDKYHETITWAFIVVINQRMAESTDSSWHQFCESNPDLFEWPGGVLGTYYADETLKSDLARRVFVLPDKGRVAVG